MSIFKRLAKPEYWFQPRQIWRRILRSGTLPDSATVDCPWGVPMRVSPKETVGHALYHLGVLELAACEAAWRLLDPGELAVDVGANIGVFSGLLARRAGRAGEVLSLEPHPSVFVELERHVSEWKRLGIPMAPIRPIPEAGSETVGEADLFEPSGFEGNFGTASLEPMAAGTRHRVRTNRLDLILPQDRPVGLLKIDTEGHELSVINGAGRFLTDGRIRDIIFEDHGNPPNDLTRTLAKAGYKVLFVGHSFWGPRLTEPTERASLPDWVAPNYLATRDPRRALERCGPSGWKVLKG